MFNHKKVSIDPRGHDSPVTYLINNRYLADPKFVPISFDSETPIAEPRPGMDYSAGNLEDLGKSEKRNHRIVDITQAAAARHPRIIVFCPSVGSAIDCERLLKARGVAAAAVTANTPTEDRKDTIDTFKSDTRQPMVIFNYGVLTAGFDAPRTRCVIIARPTTSLVLYSQMVGRAMRGPRAGGNSWAEILTVADTNLPGFGSITEAFTNWEELWSTN